MQKAVGERMWQTSGVISISGSLSSTDSRALGKEALTRGHDSSPHLTRVLCFVFVNQIHQEEPGTRTKGIINEKKIVLDTGGRKPKFIYSIRWTRERVPICCLASCRLLGLYKAGKYGIRIHINLKISLFVRRAPLLLSPNSELRSLVRKHFGYSFIVYKYATLKQSTGKYDSYPVIFSRPSYHENTELKWRVCLEDMSWNFWKVLSLLSCSDSSRSIVLFLL